MPSSQSHARLDTPVWVHSLMWMESEQSLRVSYQLVVLLHIGAFHSGLHEPLATRLLCERPPVFQVSLYCALLSDGVALREDLASPTK